MNPGIAARFYEAIVSTSYCTDPELRDHIYKVLIETHEKLLWPEQTAIEERKPRNRRKMSAERVAEQVAQ